MSDKDQLDPQGAGRGAEPNPQGVKPDPQGAEPGPRVGDQAPPPVVDLEEARALRERSQERAKREEDQAAGREQPKKEIPGAFVLSCLEAEALGDGLLFNELHKGKYIFDHASGEWYVWQGHHWAHDEVNTARAQVDAVAQEYFKAQDYVWANANTKDAAARKAAEGVCRSLEKRTKRLRKEAGRIEALGFAAVNPVSPMGISGSELDSRTMLIAFKNGVVDLETGRLRPGRQDDYLVKSCPFDFPGLDADASLWEQTLLEIHGGNQGMVDFLGRVAGAALTGRLEDHILPVLWGEGRNGKSLFMDILQAVWGSLAGVVPSELLLDQNSPRSADAPSPTVMSLRGLRMAFASETDEHRRFSATRVKWLSGGDTLTGRWPNDKRPVTFSPSHTLFLSTNHKPGAPAHDYAFWDRVLLIEHLIRFVNGEPRGPNERRRDPGLKRKLMAIAPAIAAWCVRHCLEKQRLGLAVPPAVTAATRAWRADEDVIAQFIDECCATPREVRADPSEFPFMDPERLSVQSSELYGAYEAWYKRSVGKLPVKQKKFSMAVAKLGYERKKEGGGLIFWQGLALNPNAKSS